MDKHPVQPSGRSWMDRQMEPFRCRQCQKLLLKVTNQRALKPGEALEIKCACKTLNYLMGTDN